MYTVVLDANVLYPAPLRDLLIRVGMKGIVRVRWTDLILDECFRNILANRSELSLERLTRTRELMNLAIRDAMIQGYEALIPSLELPDPDDRHVLAAAIRSGAQSIVTFNIKDFPPSVLGPLGVEALRPDDFLLDLLDLAPGAVASAVSEQANDLNDPPVSVSELLQRLVRQGLPQTVAKLEEMF